MDSCAVPQPRPHPPDDLAVVMSAESASLERYSCMEDEGEQLGGQSQHTTQQHTQHAVMCHEAATQAQLAQKSTDRSCSHVAALALVNSHRGHKSGTLDLQSRTQNNWEWRGNAQPPRRIPSGGLVPQGIDKLNRHPVHHGGPPSKKSHFTPPRSGS